MLDKINEFEKPFLKNANLYRNWLDYKKYT